MSSPLYIPGGGPPGTVLDEESVLAGLNDAQREAVTAPPGPLLVVAGAGTGKTRVLTRRVAWRILRGVSPRSVLAITFTNKAADVLKERLAGLPGGAGVTAGTFHGFCANLLRRFADRIGGTRDFTILDQEDQSRLLRDLCDDLGVDTTAHRPDAFASVISYRKNGGAGRTPAALRDARFVVALGRVETAYAERLRASGLYDFDDLLLEALRVLRESPEAAAACRERWRVVLVDEYQDTNGTQMELLRALVGDAPDLTVVGDPDQSIYRWRGASIRNILRFPDDFPGTRVVKLEENYRSTRRILAAAEAVIARNAQRFDKRLRTANDDGPRVRELRSRDPVEEAGAVVAQLSAWRAEGMPWAEMAVFVRVNHAARATEVALRQAGVPYVVVSGVEFFQRREVKDVLAWARLVVNPRDEAAFSRAVNAPRRGVGDTSVARVRAAATARGVSVPEAAFGAVPGLPPKARKALDAFGATLNALRAMPRAPVGPLLQAVVVESGYRRELLASEDELARARVENVDELVAAAHEADRARPGTTLEEFLERTALVADQDGFQQGDDRVSLMTTHAAKGLEFDGVVVVGAEEGWWPHARSADRDDDVEEERRLFYVAMTRARRRLVLTHAAQRDSWGGLERRQPSRFLLDVPDDLVEVVDRSGLYGRVRARNEAAARARSAFDPVGDEDLEAGGDDVGGAGEAVYRREGSSPGAGDRVVHPYFGRGLIVSTSGSGASLRLVVAFDEAGTRTLLHSMSNLVREGGPA